MAVLDLFSLLVQNLFGSLMLATAFVILCFWIFGAWMRMGILLMTSISVLYLMIVLTAGYGGVVGALMFLACSIYFVTALIPWISGMWDR